MNTIEQIRERRRAWNAAYLAASPKEQARMLAEEKERRAKEQEEREKRIYADRKERFLKKCDEQIAVLKTLVKLEKVALEIVEKFDGKVLNNRLTNVVSSSIKNIEKYSWAELKYDNYFGTKLTVTLSYFHGWHNNFAVEISCEDGRIDAAKTLENYESRLEKLISEWKDAKKSYDKTFKKAMKISQEIENYRKESVYLREFLRTEHVIAYHGDL